MDYGMYPFDTQRCRFHMKSTGKNMTYEVRQRGFKLIASRIEYETLFQVFTTDLLYNNDSLVMEAFDISYIPLRDDTLTNNKEMFSLAGFVVEMRRSPVPFFMNVYLPTALLTVISFIGFLIPVDVVPGRMALLVTIFLMLVNISNDECNRSPTVRNKSVRYT